MIQTAPLAPNVPGEGPRKFISPNLAYAFAFAFPAAPLQSSTIGVGEIVTIAVADGTRAPHDPGDWFAARTPARPAATGPLPIGGVSLGDMLEIEVLALEPEDPALAAPLIVTIFVMGGEAGHGPALAQFAMSAGGVVRFRAWWAGGLVSFGPVCARDERSRESGWHPVAARVTVRCMVERSRRG